MNRIMRTTFCPDRFWLTRHYLALSTITSVAIALAAPGSLNAQALQAGGPYGWGLLMLLLAIGLALLAEAFSTVFCARLQLDGLRDRRHTLLMLLAIGQLCMAFVVVKFAPPSAPLVLRFGLDAFMATLVAFLDLFHRHKADRCSL